MRHLAQQASQQQAQGLSLTDEQAEPVLDFLRQKLQLLERAVEEMMNLVYQVDVYLSDPSTQLKAGFNPKEALDHVGAVVHVSLCGWLQVGVD